MLSRFLRRIAPLVFGLTLFLGTSVLAQTPSTVLDAPAAPLEDTAAAKAATGSGDVTPLASEAKAYAVDYAIALRNLCGLAVVVLVVLHVQAADAKKRGRKHEHRKSYTAAIVLSMLGLLAMQALSFWLYTKESREPGGQMHKTVPFGRTYFLY